jgi:hypothetical protein
MPSIALLPAVHVSLRQVFRNYRMSVLASTTFIGPRQNNFSHKINERSMPPLSHPDSTCPGTVHLLSQDAATAVPMRFNRCPDALHPFVPIRSSRPPAPALERSLKVQFAAPTTADPRASDKKIGGKRIAPCRHRSQQQP